jgi:hypothetical protein
MENFPNPCSLTSRQAGEALAGTASRAGAYLLLEYPGKWAAKAVEESDLPATVKDRLAALTEAVPGGVKTLLIRQPRPHPDGRLHLFAAAAGDAPTLYEFHLAAYEQILKLDLPGLLGSDPAYAAYRRAGPLFLVCTHGRRDPCCSRAGIPVFEALSSQFGENVWQTSHLGGHRFAANLIALPHGLAFGRLDPNSAVSTAREYAAGRLDLEHLRGRSALPPAAQFAEIALRRATDLYDLDDLRLAKVETDGDATWIVTLNGRDGRAWAVNVHSARLETPILESCSSEALTHPLRYHLGGIQRL